MAACTLYNLCFFVYVWLMPVFLQFLIRAPSNFDPAPFYPVPTRTLSGDVPELYMSSFPQTTRPGVNHCRPCQEMGGQRSGMYQWDIMLSISEKDLIKESKDKPVSTMYPLVFASNDAKIWKVVADADDVAGKGHWAGKNNDADEATHLSAPLLVANLKNFGCIDQETSDTDPFFHHFASKEKALQYKWRLVKHVAMHGSVNLVACVMQGLDDMNQLIHTYARDCLYQGEMKCHLTPAQALGKCFAIGSACGQACGYFTPKSPVCKDGMLDTRLFSGLTHRRVKVKTSPGGGGAAEALVYCSKSPCDSGMHFNNMYVEAENPIEFLKAQMDVKNKEKGSYYVLMFAMSDFHAPMHEFEVVSDDDDEDEDSDSDSGSKEHHKHHAQHDHESATKEEDKDTKDADKKKPDKEEDKKEDAEDKKHHTTEAPKEKKKKKKAPEKRTCVDLPGVRLAEIDNSDLAHFVKDKKVNSPLSCTARCGEHKECQQSIFAQANKGCYLFKIPTVEVRNYSSAFNSSYCGPSHDKSLMMTMLHQAYKNYVPPAPPKPLAPLRRLKADEDDVYVQDLEDGRGLLGPIVSSSTSEEVSASKKYYWQIAHVPNGTRGVLTDQGANEVRVIPRNTSCFTTPGFVYMVACMTAKPVYVPDRTHPLRPPPFNDRCLAVGGLCGATCGSGQQVTENVAKYCPLGSTGRRLHGGSPYASAHIPRDMMVQRIDPQRNSNQGSYAARLFFNLFIFIATVSYVATILSKLPGLFSDRHPIHTWDEIQMHSYVADRFGSAVTCTTSTDEDKNVVMRNWIGKITTRPNFGDGTHATFAKWVDVFCDEGHREGARLLWQAWADFLDTNPPLEFLLEWATALKDVKTPEVASKVSPFDLKSSHLKNKKVLPVVPGQASAFGKEAPQGGVTLQPESLARLKDLADIFQSLPADLSSDVVLSNKDDVVLTRRLLMDLQAGTKPTNTFSVAHSNGWQKDLDKKLEGRAKELGIPKDRLEKSLMATDKNGKKVSLSAPSATTLKQEQFPLNVREPLQTKNRQVIMIYCARGKPETDRKGVEKTRGLDKYLWATLRPVAVRKGDKDGQRVVVKKKGAEEEKPLLDDGSERSWSSVSGGEGGVVEEVKRAVEGTVERQHREAVDEGEPSASQGSSDLTKDLTKAYLRYRTVDSDWEMARFCYGEVVGEEKDQDGDTVIILDNPSAALLSLVADPPPAPEGAAAPMGLVAVDGDDERDCFGNRKGQRTVRASRPTLQFKFTNTQPDSVETSNFSKEMTRRLQQACADPTLDMSRLKFQESRKGNELVVDVTGPGKTIELIRAKNIRDLEVINYRGRMMDTHPCIAVKKDLLMPYEGVRGTCGGLNFVVDLLQFREGFIGTGADYDSTPDRMLMGVLDCKQQPHPDFWKRCLPKFLMNTDKGYSYKVNDEIALVQAPESAGTEDADSLMGVSFGILNMIRNRCGGVTASSTNEVWQVNAKKFSRQEDQAVMDEFFHSRTLVSSTATTHARFCKGMRSVYVQEKVATGLNKSNSEILTNIQMRAEGSVQLFWVELLIKRSASILKGLLAMLLLLGLMWLLLFGPTSKDIIGYNFFCDADTPSLLLGSDHPLCTKLCDIFGMVLVRNGDKERFQMAEHDYMQLIEMSICWLLGCLILLVVTIVMSSSGLMPPIVRMFIMVENITYWMTSWNIFYWLALVLFMVIGMDPPLLFNGSHFMFFALLVNITQHCMLNEYKSMSDCTEISIWRSQQSYTLAAPLYIAAIVQGTINGWFIVLGRRDCSYWNSATTAEIVTAVTVWVSFIWVAFICCVGVIIAINVAQLVLGQTPSQLQGEEHFSAAALIGLIAITVWEPFLNLWGVDRSMENTAKDEKTAGLRARLTAKLLMWWRSKAWILRYIIDFVIPILVLCGVLKGSHMLITLVAYAGTVHGLRM